LSQGLKELGSRVGERLELSQPPAAPAPALSEAGSDCDSPCAVDSPEIEMLPVVEPADAVAAVAAVEAVAEAARDSKADHAAVTETVVGPTAQVEAKAQESTGQLTAKRIVSWDELPAAVQKQWLGRITKLTLPPVSYDAREEELSPKELVGRVKQDPMLCAKILAVANSAAQGQVQPVTSIERAAVRLGTNMLRIIIAAYHLEAIFGHYPNYSREHFAFVQRWSCAASVFAYHLAAHGDSTDRHMLSTAALVSRLGCLILGVIEHGPDGSYRDIQFETERSSFESERWKATTPLLSEQLARHWGLPDPLPSLLRLQEQPLVEEVELDSEGLNLLILCLSSIVAAASINGGSDVPLAILGDAHYEMLAKNMVSHHLGDAVRDTWTSKRMQREFISILEAGSGAEPGLQARSRAQPG
jgi:HD-like signal output (HDOD) protein